MSAGDAGKMRHHKHRLHVRLDVTKPKDISVISPLYGTISGPRPEASAHQSSCTCAKQRRWWQWSHVSTTTQTETPEHSGTPARLLDHRITHVTKSKQARTSLGVQCCTNSRIATATCGYQLRAQAFGKPRRPPHRLTRIPPTKHSSLQSALQELCRPPPPSAPPARRRRGAHVRRSVKLLCAAVHPALVKMLHEAAQEGLPREGVGVADEDAAAARARHRHVHAPLVRQEADAAGGAAADRGDDDHLLLAALEAIHRAHLGTLHARLWQQRLQPAWREPPFSPLACMHRA